MNIDIYTYYKYLSISISIYLSLSLCLYMWRTSAQVSSSRSELTAWKSTLEAAHQALVDACAVAKGVNLDSGVPMAIVAIPVIPFVELFRPL